MRNLIPGMISLALLAVLIYLSDFEKILETLRSSNLAIIGYGIALWFIGALLRNVRWRYLLKKIRIHVPFFVSLRIYIISLYISNLTPAKVGDPARSLLLKRYTGPTFSSTVSSIIIERTAEILLLVTAGLLGVFFLPRTEVTYFILVSAGIYLALVSLMIFVIFSEKRALTLAKIVHRAFSFIPKIKKLERTLTTSARMISHSISVYKNPTTMLTLFLFTLAVWVIEVLIVYMGFSAIGASVPIWAVALITPITIMIGVLTLLPGGLGSIEFANVILYATMFGLPPAQILAASLIARLMSYWMYMITGPILLSTRIGKRHG